MWHNYRIYDVFRGDGCDGGWREARVEGEGGRFWFWRNTYEI